jgi:tetratricopeptide (TPR) repeat protein/HEAT repeat protein
VRWLAAALLISSLANADWEVKRSPFDPKLVARYKQLLKKNPDDEYAFKHLVELYKKYRTLDQLIDESKGDHRLLGDLYRTRGDLDRAADEYSAAAAKRQLADLWLSRGDAQKALTIYRELTQTKPVLRKVIDATLMPSSGLSNQEMVAAAQAAYLKLLAENPKDTDTRRELADMLASHGQPKAAVEHWKILADGLHGDPGRHADAEKRIGELEEAAGDEEAALAAYRKTYSLAPAGHHLRREAIDKIIGVYRKKDELRTLIGTWERDWTHRDFVEWETLARLHDEAGDPARAKECFQKALAIDPHAIDARRRLIAIYEREAKADEALAEWRKLVQAAPGEARFRLELAERLWKTPEGGKEAVAICEKLGRDTSDPSVHTTLAELYARWGLADKALHEREQLVRLEPNDDAHLIALGELWYQRGKKEKALEIWKRILSIGPKREQQMARLAEVYAEHEMPGEALDLYQKAVKIAPADLTLQKGLASALERMKREGEAEKIWLDLFLGAAKAGKRSQLLELRQHLITLLQREGKLSFRVNEWRRRLDGESDAQVKTALSLLVADADLKLGRIDNAEEILARLAEKSPDNETRADALMGLSQVYKQRRKLKEAVTALEKAAELMPGRAREIYAQIAELSLSLYRDADALAYAKKAIALGPADAQAQVRLGEVCERRDDVEGAVAAYQHALELDDRMWRVHFTLARLQLRRGELQAAAKLYRDVIRRAPEEELVVDAARRAIDLEEYLGTLGELERELQPLAYAHPDRKVYQKLLVELYQRHARPLVARARSGDETARKELSRMGEHALRPLLEVLSVDSGAEASEEKQAMALLGELGNPGAAAPLLKLALTMAKAHPPKGEIKNPFGSSSVPRVDLRVEAALAGARLASAEELPQLLKLAEDPEKNLRAAAYFGLGRVRSPAAVEMLQKGLADGVPDLQALACAGLGRQGARQKATEIIKLLRDGARSQVARAACAFALGAAFDRASDNAVKSALVETLDEGADDIQEKAAWALGRLANHPSPPLVKAVIVKREPVRTAALDALADHAGAIVWPEPPRGSDGLDVRGFIASLGTPAGRSGRALDARELADDFSDALSRHRDLQLRALDDLDARSDGIAAGPLSAGALSAAERASLDEMGLRLLPLLRKLAAGADRAVAGRAVEVLAKIDGGEAALAEAATSPRLEVRLAALQAISGRARSPSLTGALGKAIAAPDWRERRLAAQALGASPNATSGLERVRLLKGALGDGNGFVREAAQEGLKRLTEDPDPKVRSAASAALR